MIKYLYALCGLTAALFCLTAYSDGTAATINSGYTGAPSAGGGTEGVCGNCHGGGSYTLPDLQISISETAGGPSTTTYLPGRTYFVTATVSAEPASPGGPSPAAYGYQAQFLTSSNTEAGTLSNPGGGTQITPLTSRTYAEQSAPSTSGVFTYQWQAPASGTGTVTMYNIGNAVNGTGGTSGDRGSTSPTLLTLTEASLPITLGPLTVTARGKQALLRWSSYMEIDGDYFVIERSQDGTSFTEIATVPTRGDSRTEQFYEQVVDDRPAYYRVRAVDLAGLAALSNVARFNGTANDLAVEVLGNPFGNILTLRFPRATEEPVTLTLFTPSGRRVLTQRLPETTAGQFLRLDTTLLPPGPYYLRLSTAKLSHLSTVLRA